MNIIEGLKQKARDGFNDYIAALNEGNEEEGITSEQTLQSSGKKLIEEIEINGQPQQDRYQQQQFHYFANQTKQKQFKCVVCKKIDPKYTCPKCKIKYCSSQHYKTHNMFCTQKFFKDEVQSLLKRTKMGKQQRKKMVEMLKANEYQLLQDNSEIINETKVEQINEERLNQILSKLQDNEEIQLSQNQMRSFQAYLKEIQLASFQAQPKNEIQNKQNQAQLPLFEQYIPFWKIEQGLQQYFLLESIPIQDYNKSANKNILQYRSQSSLNLRKEIEALRRIVSFKKTSVFVVYDLVQVVYITALLFRSFNGEYLNNQQFIQTFILLYDPILAKTIAQNHPNNILELTLHDFPTVLPFLKIKLANLPNGELLNLLKSWLPFMMEDAEKIFKNKYLSLEALYRILQAFRQTNLGGIDKKTQMKQGQIIKKIEFLLLFANCIVFSNQQDSILEQLKDKICDKMIKKILGKDGQIQSAFSANLKSNIDKQDKLKQERINNLLIG